MKKKVLTIATLLSAAVVTQGALVHHWDFNQGTGSTATDVAGSNDGAIVGATWATGTGDRASYLEFNGVDGHVNPNLVLPAQTTSSTFTWAGWVKSNEAGNGIIMGNRKDGTNTDYVPRTFIKLVNTKTEWHFEGSGADNVSYGSGTLFDGTWHHIALVKDGTSLQVYRDGVADGSGTLTVSLANAVPMPFFIGGEPGQTHEREFVTGGIDDVRIYDNALSASEVAELVPEPGTLGLVAIFGGGVWFFRRRFKR